MDFIVAQSICSPLLLLLSQILIQERNEFIVSYIKYVLLIMFVGYYVSNSWKLNC